MPGVFFVFPCRFLRRGERSFHGSFNSEKTDEIGGKKESLEGLEELV